MLSIATGHIDITPQQPVPLTGFAERPPKYDGITDTLEVNLIAIKDANKLCLVYSVDVLFVPSEIVDVVLEKFGTTYGLNEEHIWMCASHTHFAPALDGDKPNLGLRDQGYYEYFKERLLQLTATVLTDVYMPVTVRYLSGEADININRRKRLLRIDSGRLAWKTLMLPNHEGQKDTSLHLIQFVSANGAIVGTLWNYACHPVHAFRRNAVSAEYIGTVRNNMRKAHGNHQLAVVFLQGFAGNLKADITTVTNTRFTDRLRYLFQLWPKYTKFPTAADYDKWVNLLWSKVEKMMSGNNSTVLEPTLSTAMRQLPLGDFIGEPDSRKMVFKRLDIGQLSLIGISAEVVTEYTALIKSIMQGRTVIPVAYTDGTCIYLPTDALLKEKGYEVEGFKSLFSIKGEFHPSLDQKVTAAVTALK